MTDKPGTAGRPVRRFAGCALPIALASILLALAVFMRPTAATIAPPQTSAAPVSQPSVQPLAQPNVADAPVAATSGEFPALTGPVVDEAGVIPAEVKARLEQKLVGLKTQSQRQLQVVTVASLRDYDIADYANRLFRTWQLGDKERNDGVLLLVAPNERRMRIEVGYGMEPIITDGFSFLVINKIITPKFKAGDLPGGIESGTDALIQQMQLPPEQAAQIAAQANAQQAADAKAKKAELNPASLIWFAFFFLFFILPMLRRMRGGRGYRSSGIGNVILWSVLDGMARGGRGGGGGWSSGGGSDWGGGGGGGWGGGGGSSGGGGASGSW
ncbi:MAG: TPM domain-containing protein [Novosphingobium sp.]